MHTLSNVTNVTFDDATRYITRMPREVGILGLLLGILIVLSSLVGNMLIICTVLRDKQLRRRHNVFVVSMAVTEITINAINDICMLTVYAKREWTLGITQMYIVLFLGNSRNASAIVYNVAITLYKYIFIVHPKFYHKVASKNYFIISVLAYLLIFPVAAVISIWPEILDKDFTNGLMYNTKSMRPYISQYYIDVLRLPGHGERDPLRGLVGVYAFLCVTFIILTACYVHLYVVIKRSSQRVQAWASSSSRNNAIHKPDRREVKFIKTMAIILVAFIVAYVWLPLVITVDVHCQLSHWVYFVFVALNWLSSSYNWMIYALANAMFRRAFKHTLLGFTKRRPVSSVTTTSC